MNTEKKVKEAFDLAAERFAAVNVDVNSALEKLQKNIVLFPPLHPTLEMGRFHFIAIHFLSSEIAIDFMQVQTMSSRDKRVCRQDIGANFIYITRFARIITGHLYAARKRAVRILESRHVICLPAME